MILNFEKKLANNAKKELLENVVYELRKNEANDDADLLVRQNLIKLVHIGGCPRDYSGCPSGWAKSGDQCNPPSGYTGFCETINASSSADQKENDAAKCEASWPCANFCQKDFSGCPAGWSSQGDGCAPGPGYNGVCGNADFSQIKGDKRRARLAAFCEFQWPCNSANKSLNTRSVSNQGQNGFGTGILGSGNLNNQASGPVA